MARDHEPQCPRLALWDAGEYDAPCLCEGEEEEEESPMPNDPIPAPTVKDGTLSLERIYIQSQRQDVNEWGDELEGVIRRCHAAEQQIEALKRERDQLSDFNRIWAAYFLKWQYHLPDEARLPGETTGTVKAKLKAIVDAGMKIGADVEA